MIRFESRKLRRVICRLEPGEELVRSLTELARRERVRAAWIRGHGHLVWVELGLHDPARPERGRPQRLEGPFDLVSLDGNVSLENEEVVVRAFASVARRTDNGIQLLGGELRAAAALHVELVLECFDDLRLERERDPGLGLSVWRGSSEPGTSAGAPAREPAKALVAPREPDEPLEADTLVPPKSVTWADVAALSAEDPPRRISEPPTRLAPRVAARPGDDELSDSHAPARGDWIEHKQFGLCRIEKQDEDGGLLIRPHSGPRKFIRLDVLEVMPPRVEDGKRIFPVRPRRK